LLGDGAIRGTLDEIGRLVGGAVAQARSWCCFGTCRPGARTGEAETSS